MDRRRQFAKQRECLADLGSGRSLRAVAEPASGAGFFPAKHPSLGFFFDIAKIAFAPFERAFLLEQCPAVGIEPCLMADQMLGAGDERLKLFVCRRIWIKWRQRPGQPDGCSLPVLFCDFKFMQVGAKCFVSFQRQLSVVEPVLECFG